MMFWFVRGHILGGVSYNYCLNLQCQQLKT